MGHPVGFFALIVSLIPFLQRFSYMFVLSPSVHLCRFCLAFHQSEDPHIRARIHTSSDSLSLSLFLSHARVFQYRISAQSAWRPRPQSNHQTRGCPPDATALCATLLSHLAVRALAHKPITMVCVLHVITTPMELPKEPSAMAHATVARIGQRAKKSSSTSAMATACLVSGKQRRAYKNGLHLRCAIPQLHP